jgi:hypothetical protein
VLGCSPRSFAQGVAVQTTRRSTPTSQKMSYGGYGMMDQQRQMDMLLEQKQVKSAKLLTIQDERFHAFVLKSRGTMLYRLRR